MRTLFTARTSRGISAQGWRRLVGATWKGAPFKILASAYSKKSNGTIKRTGTTSLNDDDNIKDKIGQIDISPNNQEINSRIM